MKEALASKCACAGHLLGNMAADGQRLLLCLPSLGAESLGGSYGRSSKCKPCNACHLAMPVAPANFHEVCAWQVLQVQRAARLKC